MRRKLSNPPYITTGHTFTAHAIASYLDELVNRGNDSSDITVAIVGAAGAMGALSAKVIARRMADKPVSLILIDLENKKAALGKLIGEIETSRVHDGRITLSRSHDFYSLKDADYVITATNATGAIIKPEHVRPGTVIIDDSQPRNTSPELHDASAFVIDVLALVPGLKLDFRFGFENDDPEITFTCLAEVALLAMCEIDRDFSLGRVDAERVDELDRWMIPRTNVRRAPFRSFTRRMTPEEVEELAN